MKDSEKYTMIFFRDGREKLIKGLEKAEKYAGDHAGEILFTYTDHDGSEHLERKVTK